VTVKHGQRSNYTTSGYTTAEDNNELLTILLAGWQCEKHDYVERGYWYIRPPGGHIIGPYSSRRVAVQSALLKLKVEADCAE
jgi:hypothetical protein